MRSAASSPRLCRSGWLPGMTSSIIAATLSQRVVIIHRA
jgi:hypothetical protein